MSHTAYMLSCKASGQKACSEGKALLQMSHEEVCGALLAGEFDEHEKVKGLFNRGGAAAPADPNAPPPAPRSRPLLDALKTMVAGMVSEYGPQVMSWLGPFVMQWLKGQLGVA